MITNLKVIRKIFLATLSLPCPLFFQLSHYLLFVPLDISMEAGALGNRGPDGNRPLEVEVEEEMDMDKVSKMVGFGCCI